MYMNKTHRCGIYILNMKNRRKLYSFRKNNVQNKVFSNLILILYLSERNGAPHITFMCL